MPLDTNLDLRVVREDSRHRLKDAVAHGLDGRPPGLKQDLLADHDLITRDLDSTRTAVGAAVCVQVAIHRLWLVGAAIVNVEDSVAIVVRVGTAVFILELVPILGLIRAQVNAVLDEVLVSVVVWAAIFIEVTVEVLGLIGTLVLVIPDGVAVPVLRATLVRLDDRLCRVVAGNLHVLSGTSRIALLKLKLHKVRV